MKKLVLLLIIIYFVFALSGCYFYGAGKSYGQLIDINVYHMDGEEIKGEYIEEYCLQYDCISTYQAKNISSVELNSPAPEYLFYVTTVTLNQPYIIEFVVKMGTGYTFKSMYINSNTYSIDNAYEEEIIGKNHHISFLVNDINEENFRFSIKNLYMQKYQDDDTYKEVEGSLNQTGRTYIKGLYFRFTEA